MTTVLGDADAMTFLARVLRLDQGALVRLRAVGDGPTELWARLPFGVLVTRRGSALATSGDGRLDVTVRAAELLQRCREPDADDLPPRRDTEWVWALPPARCRRVETLPVDAVRGVVRSAATVVREVADRGLAGRRVGERVLRDALLDHVPIEVTTNGERIGVTQRVVQAVAQMGFIGQNPSNGAVDVLVAGPWVGLAAPYGTAWHRYRESLGSGI